MEPMKQPTNVPIQTTEARLPQPAPRRFQLKLRKHTGMLVLMRSQTFMVLGSLEQCEAAYRKAQTHNLVLGWWGVFSFLFMNWIAILGNMSAIAELRRIAASIPPGSRVAPPA